MMIQFKSAKGLNGDGDLNMKMLDCYMQKYAKMLSRLEEAG